MSILGVPKTTVTSPTTTVGIIFIIGFDVAVFKEQIFLLDLVDCESMVFAVQIL